MCALAGTKPSVSGKHCHCYINKADSGDGHWVGRGGKDRLMDVGWMDGWMKKEGIKLCIDRCILHVCVLSGLQ